MNKRLIVPSAVTARIAVLAGLTLIPILLYVGFGTWAVWQTGLLVWLWWILPVCWLLTWIIAKLWKPRKGIESTAPTGQHWTPRDQAAAEIVLLYQNQVDALSPKELTEVRFYLSQLEKLSAELAKHYHPSAADPFSSLTIPELAAVVRLVADDLEELALDMVPGSRLLTVRQWKSLGHAPKWVTGIRNSVWLGSILINPLNLARYGASRATIDRVSSGIQSELLQTFYLRFIRQSGFYLIEMNSGRLRGGADAYRAAFDQQRATRSLSNLPEPTSLTIGLVGQVSSGKSSLINALVGESAAAVDILPQTRKVQRLRLKLQGTNHPEITLLDTPGYDEAGAPRQQLAEIETALAESDIVLLVLDAHSPARSADAATMKQIAARFTKHVRLKPPPVIAVLTHIDQLSPVMEWSPPYDIDHPQSTKEKNIVGAIEYTKQQLGDAVVNVVPVCTAADPDRRWGITDNLLPAILEQLDEGQSVAALEAFESALNRGRFRTLMQQVATAGKQAAAMWLQERLDRR